MKRKVNRFAKVEPFKNQNQMPKYHIRLVEEIWGEVAIEADSQREAEDKALFSGAADVEWNNDSETHIASVEPLKCRCCGCTDEKPCGGGCEWSMTDPFLCTICEDCPGQL